MANKTANKTTKKLKAPAKSDDKQLAEAVRASAHQIWQAGLGAFAKAQEEGGKVFSKLVKEGTDLQKRTQKLAEHKVAGVTGTVTKMADNVGKQASGSWDKLEQVFEDRVSRSLARLGVPTKKDIQNLNAKIDALGKMATPASKKPATAKPTAKLAAKKPAAAKAPVKAKAVAKAATKKPAAKKPVAKAVVAKAETKKVVVKAAKPTAAKAPAAKSAPKAASKAAPKKAPAAVEVKAPETIIAAPVMSAASNDAAN